MKHALLALMLAVGLLTPSASAWAQTCDSPQGCHDPCTPGPAQCPTCDPLVAAVCDESQDPSCCDPAGSGWTCL